MRIALEGAIVCCVCVLEGALRGAYCAIEIFAWAYREHATVYGKSWVDVNGNRETSS